MKTPLINSYRTNQLGQQLFFQRLKMDRIAIIIDLIMAANIIGLLKISNRLWRKISSNARHWPNIWHFALQSKNSTIIDLVFDHSKFHKPKPLHLSIIREIIQFGRNDLVERIMAINTYSGTVHKPKNITVSAIYTAISYREHDIIKTLLKYGANPNDSDNYFTGLASSLLDNDLAMARLLLNHGADPKLPGAWNNPHIFSAKTAEAIHLMMEYGARLDERGERGYSILHHQVCELERATWETLGKHRIPFEYCLQLCSVPDYGIEPELRDRDGNTPLHLAAASFRLDAARLLLDYGANINAEDNDGNTPLFIAIKQSPGEMAQYLLDRGADPKHPNKAGLTPIDVAWNCEYCNVHIILGHLLMSLFTEKTGRYIPLITEKFISYLEPA